MISFILFLSGLREGEGVHRDPAPDGRDAGRLLDDAVGPQRSDSRPPHTHIRRRGTGRMRIRL